MKLKSILIMSSMFIFILCGMVSCGAQEQADIIMNISGEPYFVERETVINFDRELLNNSFVAGQYIYYVEANGEGSESLWKCKIGEQAEITEVFRLDSGEKLQRFTVTGEGNVIGVVVGTGDADTRMELIETGRDGRLLWRKEIPQGQDDIDTIFFITNLLAGSDGRIYASTPRELLFFNKDGEFERRIAATGESIQGLADAGEGRVSVVENAKAGQKLTVYQAADGKEVFTRNFRDNKMWFREGNGMYYPEIDILTKYCWEDDSIQGILNLTDCGIDISAIQVFRALEQDRFLLGLQDAGDQEMRFELLSNSTRQEEVASGSEAEEQPKTKLIVASFNPQNIQSHIVYFNKAHSDYEMECKSFDAFLQEDMFNAYIVSSDGPDVIDIFSYDANLRNGYLMDLTPFLEKSEIINKDDLLPRVFEDFEEDGKIYTIPTRISMSAFACSTELLEGKDSWTVDEYLSLLERYPNAMTEAGVSVVNTKLTILSSTLYRGITGLVDYETGKAAFDGEYFRSVLKRIAELEVTTTDKSKSDRITEGEVVFWRLDMDETRVLQQAEWRNGSELTLIGYPVSGLVEGEKSSNRIFYNGMMAIHSATENADAAWDFVESYIEGAFVPNSFFISTGKKVFEERIQAEMNIRPSTIDGVPYPPITEEQAGKVMNAFNEGSYRPEEDLVLIRIINEETAPFFKGDKAMGSVSKNFPRS